MDPDRDLWLHRYLAVRRPVEVVVWVLFFCLQAAANTVTVLIDVHRLDLPFAAWQVATWEWSSNLVGLALAPAVLWVMDRKPLGWGLFRRHLPWHGLAALAFSVLHVAGMVAVRKGVYALRGAHYDFGDWPVEMVYEALKDLRTYAMIVALVGGYRLLLWRWQGEARWLVAPDRAPEPLSPPEPETAEPPERLLVKKLGKEFLIPTDEIEWVQACGNYVNLHRQQHDYPLRATLAGIEKRLDAGRFVRVHRSYLVNLALVHAIEPTEAGDARVRMKDGSSVPCSRTHLEALRQRAGRPLAAAA